MYQVSTRLKHLTFDMKHPASGEYYISKRHQLTGDVRGVAYITIVPGQQ